MVDEPPVLAQAEEEAPALAEAGLEALIPECLAETVKVMVQVAEEEAEVPAEYLRLVVTVHREW
jgi:hypothetical protein